MTSDSNVTDFEYDIDEWERPYATLSLVSSKGSVPLAKIPAFAKGWNMSGLTAVNGQEYDIEFHVRLAGDAVSKSGKELLASYGSV